jgi:hypothetical protein
VPAPTREQLNLAAHNLLRRMARRRLGLDVVRADFYSPIVDLEALPAGHWDRADPMPGLELDLERQLRLIDERLRPFLDEFRPPVHPPAPLPGSNGAAPGVLHLDNPWYGPLDAQLLYAMIRAHAPSRVLELGSGFSTLFIEQALARNAQAGTRAAHQVVDPHPSPLLGVLGDAIELRVQSAADTPRECFDALGPGDVLFVDTSHAVRPGGEVIRLVLEVLPALAPGVVVHFHDIFRPFAYPRIFYERYNVHWQEQYLLQAFLAYNPTYEVLLANHALWRIHPERMTREFAGLREGMQPGGFWLLRREP